MHTPPVRWPGVLRRLRSELPEYALEAWIEPLIAEERATELVLRAPSHFHAERVHRSFLELIRECAAKEVGARIAVTVTVGEGGVASASRCAEPEAPQLPPAGPPAGELQRAPSAAKRPRAASPPAPAAAAPALPLDQSFGSFVVGPENALAREASFAIANGRQLAVSPLFLAGPSGTGKTHLARALVREARRRDGSPVVYTSAEGFTSRLLGAIRGGRTAEFKRSVRSCRLFVLEDVQFLEGKKATQLELFHTFEHLRAVGAGVVFTGDRLPRDLGGLGPRLRSQLSSGLVAEIEPPDAALRREILRSKAAAGGVRLPEPCLDRLVDATRGSVRDVEGVLVQLVASAALLKRTIDLELTEAALYKVNAHSAGRALTLREVIEAVAAFCGSSPEAMASRSRRRDVMLPRQLAMYLAHRFTDASLSEIARAFGREHSSARNAIQVIERAVLERAPLRYRVEALAERLEAQRRGAR